MRPSFSYVFACAVVVAPSIAGCASSEPETVASEDAALVQGEVLFYPAGQPVDQDELSDLGPPEALGGTVLEGDPHISARIDYADGALLAGVFQGTRGKVLIHFPFTEHATILFGEVAITDQSGHSHLFKPGDSYLIHQGSDVVWQVHGKRVQKSFFNRVEAADSPGPMIVYPKGSVADADDLVDLGPPASLGGTVIAGDPHISARFDYASAGLLAGVFQATRGTVLVDFPFTEHATITRGTVDLADEDGATIHMSPGDAYLIAQGSHILWNVKRPSVQKSFFNFTYP